MPHTEAVSHALSHENRADHPVVLHLLRRVAGRDYSGGAIRRSIQPRALGSISQSSMTDALGGWLGPLKRSITERQSRKAMRNSLIELKEKRERPFPQH